ncbi:centrosomal protein of 63 kDa isoform X2 [Pogona vitticeps]
MEALLERMKKQGQGRGFLTSCEAELQELMKQIDIMVAHKRAEWESRTQTLESCLDIREQELSSLRNALDEKRKEIERLCQRLEGMEQLNHDVTVKYEQQLCKIQEELARLKKSYEKLLKKQLKEARQASKSQEEDPSEISILTKKLEEFRQKSLDWEKQRLQYQQHVASLEAQRKALAEQSELIQTQLSSRKQVFESVELASQSEIHHLSSKLERANDTICANELEMERLNMRVDDLTDTNQKILEEQQRLLEELQLSRNSLEVLHDEKMELRATLLSQEDFIKSLQIHNEQLQQEVSKLTEILHTKDTLIRSLELQLPSSEEAKGNCHIKAGMEHMQLQLDHTKAQSKSNSNLGFANTNGILPHEELTEKCQKLCLTEEHLCQAKAEIKKLKDQLSHKEQSHSSELEGMKQEVTQLTRELHQRDIMLASSSGSTSNLEQQLRLEIEKAERKAVEHRAILSQLEALRQENQHLSEMLQKAKSAASAELQESYDKALNRVESENQQLQKELEETRATLGASSWVPQDKYESIVLQRQHQVTEIKNIESRKIQELQHKHEQEMKVLQARFDETVQYYEKEIQKMQHLSAKVFASNIAAERSPMVSRNNSVESCDHFLRSDPLPHGNMEFTDDVSSEGGKEFLPLSPVPTTNLGAIAAKFLEEEEERSHHILERLDAHIEELKRESKKTVQQFAHQK